MVLYRSNLKRILPSRDGRLVSPIDYYIVNPCIFAHREPGISPCLMVAASVSRSHGHTSDATVSTKQRPAAAAGGYRLDRPFQRQPHAVPRAIADQLQPAHGAAGAVVASLEQSQQLKQTREQTSPLLTVSSLVG